MLICVFVAKCPWMIIYCKVQNAKKKKLNVFTSWANKWFFRCKCRIHDLQQIILIVINVVVVRLSCCCRVKLTCGYSREWGMPFIYYGAFKATQCTTWMELLACCVYKSGFTVIHTVPYVQCVHSSHTCNLLVQMLCELFTLSFNSIRTKPEPKWKWKWNWIWCVILSVHHKVWCIFIVFINTQNYNSHALNIQKCCWWIEAVCYFHTDFTSILLFIFSWFLFGDINKVNSMVCQPETI